MSETRKTLGVAEEYIEAREREDRQRQWRRRRDWLPIKCGRSLEGKQ